MLCGPGKTPTQVCGFEWLHDPDSWPGTKLDNIQSMSCRVLGKTEQDLETQTSSISMGGCRGEPFFMSLGSSGMV